MSQRLAPLLEKLMHNTVLADFFAPADRALNKVRFNPAVFAALPMSAFCLLGCLRHLHGTASLREHIQHLFHLTDADVLPVARSTCSDALSASSRCHILTQTLPHLVTPARAQLNISIDAPTPCETLADCGLDADRRSHPMGESKRKKQAAEKTRMSCGGVQTAGGRIQVRWEAESAATPMDHSACIRWRMPFLASLQFAVFAMLLAGQA